MRFMPVYGQSRNLLAVTHPRSTLRLNHHLSGWR